MLKEVYTKVWKDLFTEALDEVGESWSDVKQLSASDKKILGTKVTKQIASFVLKTKNRVYLPVVGDDRQWVTSMAKKYYKGN